MGGVGCSALTDFDGYTFGAGRDAGIDSGSIDSGTSEGGVDAGRDGAVIDSGPRPVTGAAQTSGGALLVSPTHKLRVYVGAPQPMGERSNATHRVRTGPGSLAP